MYILNVVKNLLYFTEFVSCFVKSVKIRQDGCFPVLIS